MSRSFRLTRRAEESLVSIARWTIAQFEPKHAELYQTELLDRCDAIVRGHVQSRSYAILVDGVGEHFLVFLDRPDAVIVVDLLHSRSDLPRHVAVWTALGDDSA